MPRLKIEKKPFDRVGAGPAATVLFAAMRDGQVLRELFAHFRVPSARIGRERAPTRNIGHQVGINFRCRGRVQLEGPGTPAAFKQRQHNHLVDALAHPADAVDEFPAHVASCDAKESFVGFDDLVFAAERRPLICAIHRFADAVRHEPC